MRKDIYDNLKPAANLMVDIGKEVCIIGSECFPEKMISVIEENYKYSLYRALRNHLSRSASTLGGYREGWFHKMVNHNPSDNEFLNFYRSALDILCDLPFYIDQKKYYPIRQSSYVGYGYSSGKIFLLLSIIEPEDAYPHVIMLKGIGYTDFSKEIGDSFKADGLYHDLHIADRSWVCNTYRIQNITYNMRDVCVLGLDNENRKESLLSEKRIPGRNGIIEFIKNSGKFEQVRLYGSYGHELAYRNPLQVNSINESIVNYIKTIFKPLSTWKKMLPEIREIFPTNCHYDEKRFNVITSRAVAEAVRNIFKSRMLDNVRCIIRHGAYRTKTIPNEAYYLEFKIVGVPNTQFGFFPFGLMRNIPPKRCFSYDKDRFLLFYGCTHNQHVKHNYPESTYQTYKQDVENIIRKHLGLGGKEPVCGKTDNSNQKWTCNPTVYEGTESLP